jgi:hypothetical protein
LLETVLVCFWFVWLLVSTSFTPICASALISFPNPVSMADSFSIAMWSCPS